jgi:hypothetical protein
MSRRSAGCPRSLGARAALAALAIAAVAAAPGVAFAEAAIHPAKTTVSADPSDNPPVPPDPRLGGYSAIGTQNVDNFDYTSITGDGGAGGGGGGG